MMTLEAHQPPAVPSTLTALLPLMAVVLIAFLVIGVAMPVLPLHVSEGLGFGPFMVGLVAGCQFAASLVARIWSGRTADAHGAKRAVVAGLAAAAVAGLLYLLSLGSVGIPRLSVAILLAGRAVLGGAESFIITGATTWGLARVGARNAGKVIAWMGTAMFAAFAGGAPLGTALYESGRVYRRRTCHGSGAARHPASDRARPGRRAERIEGARTSCPSCAGSGCLDWAPPSPASASAPS